MRICKVGYSFLRLGERSEPKKREPKKKAAAKPLTAAEHRRLEEVRRKLDEFNQGMNNLKVLEIR